MFRDRPKKLNFFVCLAMAFTSSTVTKTVPLLPKNATYKSFKSNWFIFGGAKKKGKTILGKKTAVLKLIRDCNESFRGIVSKGLIL